MTTCAQHARGIGKNLDFCRVDLDIRRAKLHADHQPRNIHAEFGGDVAGQAFDLDFAGDDFEDAALELDALRFTERVHRHLDAHAHIHGDAQQVHMQEMALHRVHQPVLHDRGLLVVVDLDLENRVVPRGRPQNRGHLLGVDLERLRVVLAAINDRGNLSGERGRAAPRFCPGSPGAMLPQ